jgi:hypothetical protein
MRRSTTLLVAAVSTLALALPTAGAAQATRPGLPGSTVQGAEEPAPAAAEPKGRKSKDRKLALTKSAPGAQPGVPGAITITAKVGRPTGKAKTRGKVVFSINGATVGRAKVRKGRASFAVPALDTGDYTIKARLGTRRGSEKFRVYASALRFTTPTTFTLSKASSTLDAMPALAGTVVYKDTVATSGFVDIYPLGSPLGASNTVDFEGVGADDGRAPGTFDFANANGLGNQFLARLQSSDSYPPGTYRFQAYYAVDGDFVDYLTSSVITVTITP